MSEREFDGFFIEEYPAVLRTISLMLGDRQLAEDVCQEAFYRVFVHWRRVSGYDKPGAFARRVAIRMAGKAAKRRPREIAEVAVATPEPEVAGVREAIRELPAMQRAAVALHYFEDRPISEIASILGCSEGTVKTHLHRARRKLAESLGEEERTDVAR